MRVWIAVLATLAALVALLTVAVIAGALDVLPSSLRKAYQREVRRELAARSAARSGPTGLVTEADLARLPKLVAAYLRRAGVVGRPRVRALHAAFSVRFRTAADAPFMKGTAEQHEFFGPPGPARLFLMKASRAGIPFVAFHRYVGAEASMRVRAAGLVEVAEVGGPAATRSETVTLLNDICMLAPAALVDAPIAWRSIGPHEVVASFANAGHTISAVLTFDEAGDLVGFVSGDRHQLDGKTDRVVPWSTPLGGFRNFGGVRLPAYGEARWRDTSGEWTYGQFTLERISYE
jgi:hypothetical protein